MTNFLRDLCVTKCINCLLPHNKLPQNLVAGNENCLLAHDSVCWLFWAELGSSATWCQLFLHALESVGRSLRGWLAQDGLTHVSQFSTGKTGSFSLHVVSLFTYFLISRSWAQACSQHVLVPREGISKIQVLLKPRLRNRTVLLSPHYVGQSNSQDNPRFKVEGGNGGGGNKLPLSLKERNSKIICRGMCTRMEGILKAFFATIYCQM